MDDCSRVVDERDDLPRRAACPEDLLHGELGQAGRDVGNVHGPWPFDDDALGSDVDPRWQRLVTPIRPVTCVHRMVDPSSTASSSRH